MRMKSIGLGIQSRSFDHTPNQVEVDVESEELAEFELSDEQMNQFLEKREIPLPQGLNLAPNEFVRFKSPLNRSRRCDDCSAPTTIVRTLVKVR